MKLNVGGHQNKLELFSRLATRKTNATVNRTVNGLLAYLSGAPGSIPKISKYFSGIKKKEFRLTAFKRKCGIGAIQISIAEQCDVTVKPEK